jgi:hypothetical protein
MEDWRRSGTPLSSTKVVQNGTSQLFLSDYKIMACKSHQLLERFVGMGVL